MFRSNAVIILISFFTAELAVPYVNAQNRGISIQLEYPSLLNNKNVQEELNLTGDQKTKVDEAIKESVSAMKDSLSSFPLRPAPGELPVLMQKLGMENKEDFMNKLRKILSAKQIERIDQLRIQSRGPQALLLPEIIKALEITEAQQKELNDLHDEYQSKIQDAYKSINSNANPEERREKMNELEKKIRKARKILGDMMLQVLTKDQRDKFEKMQGAMIEFDLSTSRIKVST